MAAGDNPACIVIGDTNLNKLTWDTPEQIHVPMVDQVKEEIETKKFLQVIENPTRFWNKTTSSLIDQVWLNCVEKMIEWKNTSRATSDHNVVSIVVKCKGANNNLGEHIKRSMKNWKADEYLDKMKNIDWTSLYMCDNIDIANNIFVEKITNILNTMSPMIKVQDRKNTGNKWLSQETRDMMTTRDNMRNLAATDMRQQDWDTYKELRNQCNLKVKSDRRQSLKTISDRYCEDKNSAGLFRMAKNRMGWTTMGPPNLFIINGKTVRSPLELANTLVNHYRQKLRKLKNNLPQITQDPMILLDMALHRWGNLNTTEQGSHLKN